MLLSLSPNTGNAYAKKHFHVFIIFVLKTKYLNGNINILTHLPVICTRELLLTMADLGRFNFCTSMRRQIIQNNTIYCCRTLPQYTLKCLAVSIWQKQKYFSKKIVGGTLPCVSIWSMTGTKVKKKLEKKLSIFHRGDNARHTSGYYFYRNFIMAEIQPSDKIKLIFILF